MRRPSKVSIGDLVLVPNKFPTNSVDCLNPGYVLGNTFGMVIDIFNPQSGNVTKFYKIQWFGCSNVYDYSLWQAKEWKRNYHLAKAKL